MEIYLSIKKMKDFRKLSINFVNEDISGVNNPNDIKPKYSEILYLKLLFY